MIYCRNYNTAGLLLIFFENVTYLLKKAVATATPTTATCILPTMLLNWRQVSQRHRCVTANVAPKVKKPKAVVNLANAVSQLLLSVETGQYLAIYSLTAVTTLQGAICSSEAVIYDLGLTHAITHCCRSIRGELGFSILLEDTSTSRLSGDQTTDTPIIELQLYYLGHAHLTVSHLLLETLLSEFGGIFCLF